MPAVSVGSVVAASVLAIALSVDSTTAAHAAEPAAGGSDVVVGDFGLGDGLEGGIDPRLGSFEFQVVAGGVIASWNSSRVGEDRYELGPGWSWHTAGIDVDGGVRVFPTRGGVFPASVSSPSGLLGYHERDLVFEQRPGSRLAARADGSVGEREYAYVLHELGGVTTYFTRDGHPAATVGPTGERMDWEWHATHPHRLVGVVNADGVRTELDWDAIRNGIVVRPAANVAKRDASAGVGDWRILFRDDTIDAVVDPLGGRVDLETTAAGLVEQLTSPSGATTDVEWTPRDDGTAQVAEVRVSDDTGVLSRRRWSQTGGALASGWPAHSAGAAASGRAETELSDGKTRVRSTFNDLGLLVAREVLVTTTTGERTLQEQSFAYPSTDADGAPIVSPDALPPNWARPTTTTVVHRDASGAERESTQRVAYDDFGRPVEEVAADGTTTRTEYDPGIPGVAAGTQDAPRLAVGLPTRTVTIAADGSTTETRFELNAARTAPVAAESFLGAPGAEPVRVARSEFTVEPDGFVSEQRDYPYGDPAQTPSVTAWSEAVDLTDGTATVTERVAVGTPAEAATSSRVSLIHGGVLESTDVLGRESSATYDALGRIASSTDAAGRTTSTAYESAEADGRNAVTVTAPDGVATTEVRDAIGRVQRITDNIDRGTAVEGFARTVELRDYPDPSTVEITDAWGATTTTRQDAYGRTVETVGPDGVAQVSSFDDVAQTTTSGVTTTGSLADAELVTTATRDRAGRVVRTAATRTDGGPVLEVTTAHDGLGRVTSTTDGVTSSTIQYDSRGNTSRAIIAEADDGRTITDAEAQFDGFGTSLEKTLSDGTAELRRSGGSRELDALDRAVVLRDQLGRATSVEYTADGLPKTVTGPSGEVTTYKYDDDTRQVTKAVAERPDGATVAVGYEYFAPTGRVKAIFDVADPERSRISYTYDDFGNLLETRYPDGKTLSHKYDAHGRKLQTTDVAGHVTHYEYDEVGRLTDVRQLEAGEETRRMAAASYEYDDRGRVSALERDNGVRTELEYDSASLVTAEHTSKAGTLQSSRAYAYDARGNVTQRVDTVHGPGASTTTTTYRYDGRDRLIESTVHAGDSTAAAVERHTAYEMTPSDDLSLETVTTKPDTPEESVTTRAFGYSPVGELITVDVTRDGVTEHLTQEYDQAGNLVRALDGTIYVYDATNRLIQETTPEGETISTSYWADGARKQLASEREPGAPARTTTFYWDGGTLVNEMHAGSVEAAERGTASYLIGLLRQARTTVDESGHRTTHYAGTDRHGNVTDLTDDTGAETLRYAYSDYGVTTATRPDGTVVGGDEPWVGNLGYSPFQYANEQTDGGDAQYLRARILDLETARFFTKDKAARQNVFNFADLNPIMNVDPSGREPDKDLLYALGGWALSIVGLGLSPFSGGSSLVVAGAIVAATIDTAIATMTVIDQYAADFIPDEWTERLAITAAAVGAASFMMSAGAASWSKFGRGAKAVTKPITPPVEEGPWQPPTTGTGGVGTPRTSVFASVGGGEKKLSREAIEAQQTEFPHPLVRRNTDEDLHMEQDRSGSSASSGSEAETHVTGSAAHSPSISRRPSTSNAASEVPSAPTSQTENLPVPTHQTESPRIQPSLDAMDEVKATSTTTKQAPQKRRKRIRQAKIEDGEEEPKFYLPDQNPQRVPAMADTSAAQHPAVAQTRIVAGKYGIILDD